MIALHESLVEWTVLALGIAVAAALLVRVRRGWHWPRFWLPGVALVVIVANAVIAVNAAAAARSEAAGAWMLWNTDGATAVLLAAWLYLSRSLRVLPSAAQDEDEVECCADCPQCMEAGSPPPAESTNRRRARGLTMTRLGGG